MDEQNSKPISLLKRIVFLAVSSGILVNALYIFGWSYYQGYLVGMGFDYVLFPISRFESYVWAYNSSLVVGAGFVSGLYAFVDFYLPAMLVLVIVLFILLYLWRSMTHRASMRLDAWAEKRQLKSRHPKVYRLFKRFAHSGNVNFALHWCYWPFQVLNVAILLLALWVLFPVMGYKQGFSFAEDRLSSYKQEPCSIVNSDWDWCIEVGEGDKQVSGRLLLRNENYMGIYTVNGPLTISVPESLHYLRTKKIVPEGVEAITLPNLLSE